MADPDPPDVAPAAADKGKGTVADVLRAWRALGLLGPLTLSAVLICVASYVSDIGFLRREERAGSAFEYPVLARALYLAERAARGTVLGISVVNVVVMSATAVAVALVVRALKGDVVVWASAPLLLLTGQNWDVFTALTMCMALREWRQDRFSRSGLWLGVGACFKVVPIVLVAPLLAASGLRRGWRLAATTAVVTVSLNGAWAIRNEAAWEAPYRFARERMDVRGTVWSVIPIGQSAVNTASLVLLAGILGALFLAVRRRWITVEAGVVLSVVGFIVSNKVWQPHYFIWVLPLLALTTVPRGLVRGVEIVSLASFAIYWSHLSATRSFLLDAALPIARAVLVLALTIGVLRGNPVASQAVQGAGDY